jgi:hypothetical protein
MTLMRDLVADTRRMMYGSMADQLNFLAEEALEGAGELKMVMDVTPIQPGMVLSSGLNVYYVIGVEPATKKVTVHQSYQNSRNEALSVGQPVMIRPRVTDFLLFTYLNDTIVSLSSPVHGLYKEGQWEAVGDWNNVYQIPPEALNATGLTRVSVRGYAYQDLWYEIPMTYVEWQPEMGTVRLRANVSSQMVRFDYKSPFSPAAEITTDVEVMCGLPATMHDIPPLGAAVRLLRTTESRRDQIHTQGDSRRADEVQAGANSSGATSMSREFEARVNQERMRLVARNPYTIALPR